ncbi:3'-5' exonuclease [Streptomyces sulphureus]|uniref:3'-5' exonuclease n=1 Tax=Streptomyces sulphureus TaxID=47758 RepID=UPI00037D8C85|nr:3'-5' exonuclease [Streptomyces sulphureus]
MSWHLGRMCGFDLETTGTDVETDRIVTACVVQCGGGLPTQSATWLANPGIEIPEEAAKVHGITTERARADGRPAAEVVEQVTAALAQVARDGTPIVAMNAAFDLTMQDRECERYSVPSLWGITEPLIIDPRVLDKAVDRYRRGSRTLTALCEHYQVPLDRAHSADADAIAACRVAWRIASLYPRIATDLGELHEHQAAWAREQAESLAGYFARTPGKEHQADTVRTEWPLIPRQRGHQ